jgi:hypothetical protein
MSLEQKKVSPGLPPKMFGMLADYSDHAAESNTRSMCTRADSKR